MNAVNEAPESERLLRLFDCMVRIRKFEEAAIRGVRRAEIPGSVHAAIGHEAAIAGACAALDTKDIVTGTHRSHGHVVARGADLEGVMAELMGRAGGLCNGKGGSMHLAAVTLGMLGASGIVGGTLPIAVGAALASRIRGTAQISAAFFGDGAANTGACHEAMNLAAVWQLPVLFICENNQYALTTPAGEFVAGGGIARRADAYGMQGAKVDGQDVLAVYRAVQDAAENVRKESYPRVIELETYRYREHAELGSVVLGYRTNEEIENWKQRDPIALYRDVLIKTHGVPREQLDEIEARVGLQVDGAVERARSHEPPAKSQLFTDVFAPPLGLEPGAWSGAQCES